MIAVLGAMDTEIAEFLSCMEGRREEAWAGGACHVGAIDGRPVVVAKSGVGKAMAAMTAQYMIGRYRPRGLLFTGLAGSLRPEIRIGDTLLASDLVQHDLDASAAGFPRGAVPYSDWRFLPADPAYLAAALRYRPAAGTVHRGRICTGDQFITHREMASHAYLRGELQGAGVEMEGAAAALVCAVHGLPCLVARTISDLADGDAGVDYADFLPRASRNSLALVRHLLPLI